MRARKRAERDNSLAEFKEKYLLPDEKESEKHLDLPSIEREGEKVVAHYFIGDDFRVDSIEDLEKRAGSATAFSIRVGDRNFRPEVEVNGRLLPPRFSLVLPEQDEWSAYSRIKAIFDSRRLFFRNIGAGLPDWADIPAFLGLLSLPLLLNLFLKGHVTASTATKIGWVANITVLVALYLTKFSTSRVFFVRSHERSRLSAESRRRTARDVVMILIGAVAGAIAGALAAKYLK